MKRWNLLVKALVAGVLLCFMDIGVVYSGTMIDLGTLGGQDARALGINKNGQIAGYSTIQNGYGRAFLYSGGQMIDLGHLGGSQSYATAINESGQVVGYSPTSQAAWSDRAFLYSGGQMTNLGTMTGGNYSQAFGINKNGQIVGLGNSSNGSYRAFLYSGGVMSDLGALPGGKESGATGINDQGQIVGYSTTNTTDPYPYDSAFLYSGGQMINLGYLGGIPPKTYYSIARGINNLGQIVGQSSTSDNNELGIAFLYSGGPMINLGAFVYTDSYGNKKKQSDAYAINNKGQSVGYSVVNDEYGNERRRAVLFTNGLVINLGTLPGDSDSEAMGINDDGRIVGYSYSRYPVRYRAFLYNQSASLPGILPLLISLGKPQFIEPGPTLAWGFGPTASEQSYMRLQHIHIQ